MTQTKLRKSESSYFQIYFPFDGEYRKRVIGSQIEQSCNKIGLTQGELAKMVGTNESVIGEIEDASYDDEAATLYNWQGNYAKAAEIAEYVVKNYPKMKTADSARNILGHARKQLAKVDGPVFENNAIEEKVW